MAELVSYAAPGGPVKLPNSRVGGLIAFGVISIVLAGLALTIGMLGAIGTVDGAVNAPGGFGASEVVALAAMLLMFALLGSGLLWLGIGSIRRRRWVRPVVLSAASVALWGGILATTGLTVQALSALGLGGTTIVDSVVRATTVPAATPRTGTGPPAGGAAPPATAPPATAPATAPVFVPTARTIALVVIVMLVGVLFFGIALPTAYLLFYRSPFVARTLDAYDPGPSWTDRRPLAVLGIAIWAALLALGGLETAAEGYDTFFGNYLTGWSAAAVAATRSIMLLATAWLCFQLRPAGWWLALICVAVWGTSAAASALAADPQVLRELEASLEMPVNPAGQRAEGVLLALSTATGIVYLSRVRRLFLTGRGA